MQVSALTSENKGFQYKFDNEIIESVRSERDLGLIMDEDLTFDNHIAEKVKIANQRVGLIRRCFNFLDSNALLHLYFNSFFNGSLRN